MDSDTPEAWLPSIEGVHITSASGALWPDGWISGEVSLSCTALTDLYRIEMRGWNPDWTARYAHNVVTLSVDDTTAATPELYMGELFELGVAKSLASGQQFVIQIASKVTRSGDALDARELAIVVAQLGAGRQTYP